MRFSSFERIARRQRAAIHPGVVEAGRYGSSKMLFSYEPSGMYAAISEAGRQLRIYPDLPLTNRPLHLNDTQLRRQHSIAAAALRDILNASLQPEPAADPMRSFNCRGAKPIESCGFAENSFALTFAQMATPGEAIAGLTRPLGYQIIADGDTPIAVRKGYGEASTMTVVPTTINGIPYPAGSIMRMEPLSDAQTDSTTGPYAAASRIDIGRISHAAFVRLSAFSEHPSVRADVFKLNELTASHSIGRRVLYRSSIEDLGAIATAALRFTDQVRT